MNAPTFDSHSAICPNCHRTGSIKPGRIVNGLLTCQYCRERLVISWSGHYVRDPFTLKKLAVGRMLRRQSRPLARILRDVGIIKHPSAIAVLGSLVLLGCTLAILEGLTTKETFPQRFLEQKIEFLESDKNSP